MTGIMLAGALVGVGLVLLVGLAVDAPPRGAAGVAMLDAERRRNKHQLGLTADRRLEGESMRMRKLGSGLRRAMEARGVHLPRSVRADLHMIGRSVEGHLAGSVMAAIAGFFCPMLLVAALSVVNGSFTAAPLWLCLIGALLGAVLPTLQIRSTAADRRRDFRHVVGSFLDLVAMNLAGGRGVPEALNAALSISDSWAFVRIRDTLQTARLQGVTPWAALGELGDELAIDELRDLAAALALVAEDGAKVRDSLTARATSMRRRELADAEGRAQARSQSMLVAQLLLCVGFLLFLTYPAVARVIGV